jgi:hypothetical protein
VKIEVIEFKSQYSRFAVVDSDGDAELGNWLIALTWWREHADRIAAIYSAPSSCISIRSDAG